MGDDQYMRWIYSGTNVHSGEQKDFIEVPKEAGEWMGKTLGNYKLVGYLGKTVLA